MEPSFSEVTRPVKADAGRWADSRSTDMTMEPAADATARKIRNDFGIMLFWRSNVENWITIGRALDELWRAGGCTRKRVKYDTGRGIAHAKRPLFSYIIKEGFCPDTGSAAFILHVGVRGRFLI